MSTVDSLTSPLAAIHPDSTRWDNVLEASVAMNYGDPQAEYEAIRQRAGLLDLSGSRIIEVSGAAAQDFAQHVLARDVEYLTSERCMTSLVLAADGSAVDQVMVWGRDNGVLLESSVGAGARLLAHLDACAADFAEPVQVTDRSEEFCVFALEGPYAWGVVGRLIDEELAALPLETVVDTKWGDTDIVFARTGMTGEYGYQMLLPRQAAADLWAKGLEQATPAGQEALELAMLEVRQPALHREATDGADVLELGANWMVDITKEAFVGRDAVMEAFSGPRERRTIGFAGGATVPEAGTPVLAAGEPVGEVVYAVHSMGLETTLGLARVASDLAAADLPLTVGDDEVTTLSTPYVTPKSWSTPII